MNTEINDGGSAFPVSEEAARGKVAGVYGGMSQRALMATILMHSELTTCGVPGEACDALVKAAHDADRDVEYQMAVNAVQCADALLRALAEPLPPQPETIPLDYVAGVNPDEDQAVMSLRGWHGFDRLPHDFKRLIRRAANAVVDEDDGIPF